MKMSTDLLSKSIQQAEAWITPRLVDYIRRRTQNEELRQHCIHAILQMGLRERSWLVDTGARIAGADRSLFEPLALSAECFIAAALTSDDILDEAGTRWGMPTCISKWGAREALLIAEHLHGLAHLALDRMWLAGRPLDPEGVRVAVAEFRDHFGEFFAWQFVDIRSEGDRHTSFETVEDLAYRRTGRLLHACLLGPPTAMGASAKVVNPLSRFGHAIGTLLQLRDDVLDFIGAEEYVGKPVLGDLVNGQPNLVLHFAFRDADAPALKPLASLFHCRRALTSEERRDAVAAVERLGALQKAMDVLLSHAREGEAALMELPESDERARLLLFLGALVDLPATGTDVARR